MKLSTLIYLLIFGLPFATHAQVDSTTTDSVPPTPTPDSLSTAQGDTLQSDAEKVTFKVRPWEYHAPLDARIGANDSTLRWQVWPSWTYKKNRDPGVITYRLGTIGRTNAMQIDAQEPKYQQLYWEDIRMNDPVSGIVNWNYIPHHQVKNLYEQNLGTVYDTKFYLRNYYLNKPLTELNYTESNFDTRELRFVVSENINQKTNVELSYWDRRDGGEYDNSGIVGRQIFGHITHQIDHEQMVKLSFLNNHYDNDMPFGYVIPNLANFNFDRYNTTPVESSAKASRNSTILGLNYYRRPADSMHATSNLHAGIYLNSTARDITYSADTTAYKIQQLGTTIRKWQQVGPLSMEGGASLGYFINKQSKTLNTGNWAQATVDGKAAWYPIDSLGISGQAKYRFRSDGYSDYRFGVTASLPLIRRLKLKAGAATGSRMPTPQQLYWRSNTFQGNENISRESIQELHGSINYKLSGASRVGFRAELKQIKNGIMVGSDSLFVNTNDYDALGVTAYFSSNRSHFEFNGSATLQQFGHFLQQSNQSVPINNTQHIWLKGSAYVKGYLFHHATFVKAGLSGMISPQAYPSAQYYPSLDFWQSSAGASIPSFNRLDVDLSARIRSIMVLLRYENVLDDFAQLGYFETAGYPMTRRRFIFGIRVLFRN